jgi:hypothetical protein
MRRQAPILDGAAVLTTPRGAATESPTDGAVIVRLGAVDRTWAGSLPAVPGGHTLTVTVGHPMLLPVPSADLRTNGYRLVGVASAARPVGPTVDVLVPRDVRKRHPTWWRALLSRAERVFDLRHGPVLRVLAAELELHLRPEA